MQSVRSSHAMGGVDSYFNFKYIMLIMYIIPPHVLLNINKQLIEN